MRRNDFTAILLLVLTLATVAQILPSYVVSANFPPSPDPSGVEILSDGAAEEPFSIAMPEESVNYTITVSDGALWAAIDGVYPMHLTGDLFGLPMVYPTPPNTTNMHVWLDSVELEWGNYSDIDPSARHQTDTGDWEMIYCTVNPASEDFLLEIHYEHPVEVINGTYIFLYDLNISPYLSPDTPRSTCHFTVKLPANVSGFKVYTTGLDSEWTQISYNRASSGSGETVTFDIVSDYDGLVGDIAFVLEDVEIPEFSAWLLFSLVALASLAVLGLSRRRFKRKTALL